MWFESCCRTFDNCFNTNWIDCWIGHNGYGNSILETSKSSIDAKKQFLKNEQSSEMGRLKLQNQNLIKDLAKLDDTVSFLKDFINLEDQLHFESENGLTEKAKILIGLGADVNAKDGNQKTPLLKLQKSYFKMELKSML